MRAALAMTLVAALGSLAGCASASNVGREANEGPAGSRCYRSTAAGSREANYVFVYLKTGPESDQKTPDERRKIFEGHMANIRRLADAHQLVIAGPFDHPHDPAWRGIFVMDVPTVAEARKLVETDPGVQAGVFVPELRPMRASPALRKTLDLEREMEAEQERKAANASQPAATEPPPNIRRYVMITAVDAARASTALQKASLAEKVLWSGRFAGGAEVGETDGGRGGVFVLDATSADDVRARLNTADAGDCWIDGWWSTAALEKLAGRAAGG